MAATADAPWRGIARQTLDDLKPFPGRFAMTWRVALLCALVAGVAMLYRIPESAIGCYLIIFLMRPNGAENAGQAIGIIILVSVVVVLIAPLIQATADNPLLRVTAIAGFSFLFLFLGAASQLGESGSIIALVIAFILTLVDQVPAGEIVTRGLLYAWQMASVPMMMMVVFSALLCDGPHTLLRRTVVERLRTAAEALEDPGPGAVRRLDGPLLEGTADSDKQATLARLFHTAPSAEVRWLSGAAAASYRLLLAVAALPAEVSGEARRLLADRCWAAAEAIAARRRPDPLPAPEDPGDRVLAEAHGMVTGLGGANGGSDAPPAKVPFLAGDAFTNPDYQRFALKTTAAAVLCYLTYSLIDWSGIHTAMVTCYVASLGTAGETVHKLVLRISGCLVGAAIGIGAILYVIPHLESVGGLMALVFCAILVAGWVSSGSERISYAGVQVGLAFLLTVLSGFAPSTDMDAARDRIVGILLGNVVVWVIFTQIWPKSAVVEVRARLALAIAGLSRLAALDAPARALAVGEAGQVAAEIGQTRELLALLPFEPRHLQPAPGRLLRVRRIIADVRALLPQLMLAPDRDAAAAARLAEAADALARSARGAPVPMEAPEPEATGAASDDLTARADRLARLVTGGAA